MKVSKDEQAFLIDLHKFMKSRNTPIGRIPSLGFKQSTTSCVFSLCNIDREMTFWSLNDCQSSWHFLTELKDVVKILKVLLLAC